MSSPKAIDLLHRNLCVQLRQEWNAGNVSADRRIDALGGNARAIVCPTVDSVQTLRAVIESVHSPSVPNQGPSRKLEFGDTALATAIHVVSALVLSALSERIVRRRSAIALAQGSRAVLLSSCDVVVVIREEARVREDRHQERDLWIQTAELEHLRQLLALEEEASSKSPLDDDDHDGSLGNEPKPGDATEDTCVQANVPATSSASTICIGQRIEGTEEALRLRIVDEEQASRSLRCAVICFAADELARRQEVAHEEVQARETLTRQWCCFRSTFADDRALLRAFHVLNRALQIAESEARRSIERVAM
uniref:Uncharacterized protein n=1 Tax=Neobodo designis TaxID=312471 RepID=A0A7S1W9X3_NEODS|mmetsp:Transcript_87/g.305  ORF Transcript_87/g.305 Transcript_87/m.305 type:complete len:308 (+) Transcript_87:43-966(+)|eukprot:CAMPEP_0174854390 /NCGR_PEP_ID=MMETSP1114-20130205/31032_1 /TAXON_ID=312471 /ORGANISM="Neobodo designis, Strain CCAP 1951/1" /LENGTH=307 /DNA_ID=CAMNT_0016089083 /DNA_START=43 /DNA_END=966 /DNA_ORIENTATION=+